MSMISRITAALLGSQSPNFSLLRIHPFPQGMSRRQALSHVRSYWYRIPKSGNDPSYQMLSSSVLFRLTAAETNAYLDNLCLRRDIYMDEDRVRCHNRIRKDAYTKGDKPTGRESYQRMRLSKRVAQQKRIHLLETPFLRSSGWFYPK